MANDRRRRASRTGRAQIMRNGNIQTVNNTIIKLLFVSTIEELGVI